MKDRNVLYAVDKLLDENLHDDEKIELSEAQKYILRLSEKDIEENRLISDEELNRAEDSWLNG